MRHSNCVKSFTLEGIIMTVSHILGYPRIGAQRELKKVTEAYWKGDVSRDELEAAGQALRLAHWQTQGPNTPGSLL